MLSTFGGAAKRLVCLSFALAALPACAANVQDDSANRINRSNAGPGVLNPPPTDRAVTPAGKTAASPAAARAAAQPPAAKSNVVPPQGLVMTSSEASNVGESAVPTDWNTDYDAAGEVNVGAVRQVLSGGARSRWIYPQEGAEPGILIDLAAAPQANLIFFVDGPSAGELTEFDVTLPTGREAGEQATYQFRGDRPLRWLSLEVGQSDRVVSANDRYLLTTQRTAPNVWLFDAVRNPEGPGTFPGLEEAHLRMQPGDLSLPWRSLNLTFSTSDEGETTAEGVIRLSNGR